MTEEVPWDAHLFNDAVNAGEVDLNRGRTRYTAPSLDLAALLMSPPPEEDWILWPFVERGQQASLVSAAKAGKSLISFEHIIAASNGHAYLGRPPAPPVRVMYLDRENTRKDLLDRMTAFQSTPDQFSNIEYIAFPDMDPLDTDNGGAQLLDLVEQHRPDVVIIDTISRFIQGKEDASDTWLAVYRCSLVALKAREVAVIRLDHTGKDPERGARGSSAKSSDVDAEWTLVFDEAKNTRTLKRIRSRGSNGPGVLVLSVESSPLRHEIERRSLEVVDRAAWIAGLLKSNGVPQDYGRTRAMKVLTDSGITEDRLPERAFNAALKVHKVDPGEHYAPESI